MTVATYEKTPILGTVVRFVVTPAPRPAYGCFGIVIPAIAGFLTASLTSLTLTALGASGGINVSATSMIGLCAVWYTSRIDFRQRVHRVRSSFEVSPDAIRWKSRPFRKSDIHRIAVCNAYPRSSVRIKSTRPAPGIAGVGLDMRRALVPVSYGLHMECDGKAFLLAGGLDERTASGLLVEVTMLLDLEIR